jgi:hypothetical protein
VRDVIEHQRTRETSIHPVRAYQVEHSRRVPNRGDKQSVPQSERHQ